MWDQSPHVYSRSAETPFVLNGNTLTVVPGAAGLTSPPPPLHYPPQELAEFTADTHCP